MALFLRSGAHRNASCLVYSLKPSVNFTLVRYVKLHEIGYRSIRSRFPQKTSQLDYSSSSISRLNRKSAVNPPESTLPPFLDTPERQPGQGTISYYYNVGKAYRNFYFAAIKAVWQNRKQTKVILNRIAKSDGPFISPAEAVRAGLLTRAEYQFILRSKSDVSKIPILAVLAIVLGEWLPLVIIFMSGVIPRPAWIPKQVERVRRITEERREKAFRNGTLTGGQSVEALCKVKNIETLNRAQVVHISQTLGLHSTLWEKLWDRPPRWLARRFVTKAVDYLNIDDQALVRDGGIKALSNEELKIACSQRGIDVRRHGYDVSKLRDLLQSWMTIRLQHDVGVAAMALFRPSQWKTLKEHSKK